MLHETTIAGGPRKELGRFVARIFETRREVEKAGPCARIFSAQAVIVATCIIDEPAQASALEVASIQPGGHRHPIERGDRGVVRAMGHRNRESPPSPLIAKGNPLVDLSMKPFELRQVLRRGAGPRIEPFVPAPVKEDPFLGSAQQLLLGVDWLAARRIRGDGADFVEKRDESTVL